MIRLWKSYSKSKFRFSRRFTTSICREEARVISTGLDKDFTKKLIKFKCRFPPIDFFNFLLMIPKPLTYTIFSWNTRWSFLATRSSMFRVHKTRKKGSVLLLELEIDPKTDLLSYDHKLRSSLKGRNIHSKKLIWDVF